MLPAKEFKTLKEYRDYLFVEFAIRYYSFDLKDIEASVDNILHFCGIDEDYFKSHKSIGFEYKIHTTEEKVEPGPVSNIQIKDETGKRAKMKDQELFPQKERRDCPVKLSPCNESACNTNDFCVVQEIVEMNQLQKKEERSIIDTADGSFKEFQKKYDFVFKVLEHSTRHDFNFIAYAAGLSKVETDQSWRSRFYTGVNKLYDYLKSK